MKKIISNKILKNVRKLQIRIAKAVSENNWRKVKSLSRLLTNSFYAKLISIFKVVTNKGKQTAGVDKEIWTKEDIISKTKVIERRGYKPLPLKRIYIPKKNGKKRPLGIPTMKDRAMQALHLLALEPIAECLADPNSYGFRKNRACRDAMMHVFVCLARKDSAKFIFEADIKGCFDNINHDWILENIPMDKQILHKWLKAGYIENKNLHPTRKGTPQGGIISPTLMNLTLDGLEKAVKQKFPKWKGQKVNFIRYADDFVITAASRKIIENELKPLVIDFLEKRGLNLSEEKTRITHIDDGFDLFTFYFYFKGVHELTVARFLSQNTRKYNGKLLQKPAKKAIKNIKLKLRKVVFSNLGKSPIVLIYILRNDYEISYNSLRS